MFIKSVTNNSMKILIVTLSLLSAFSSEAAKIVKPISEEVYFCHYSRNGPNHSIELKTGDKLDPSINPKLPWKFFIHGWTTSPTMSPWFHTGKAAYFHKGEYNVVFVDWSKPANQSYILSVKNAMDVGKTIGKFIVHLSVNEVSLDDIHLLGHSLGSHMAGFTGKYVRDNVGKVGRITGLDPAGPWFESSPLLNQETLKQQDQNIVEEMKKINPCVFQKSKYLLPERFRLSKDDANFVDIIHTDALHFGMLSNIGHCDFHPNGGKPLQPGCETTTEDNCSHARSVEFFVESINLNNFVARECESYEEFESGNNCKDNKTAVMGEHADPNTRGVFYLKTNAQQPYGKGDV